MNQSKNYSENSTLRAVQKKKDVEVAGNNIIVTSSSSPKSTGIGIKIWGKINYLIIIVNIN